MSLKTLGRYEIVKLLGQGAMGLVYEAHDPNIQRSVAIKTIHVDQLSTEMAAELEARFRCETQAGGRLAHPNIIGVYDAGRDQGLTFMVMELVRGGDLRQLLESGQPLRFEHSMGLMKELLSALNFAHEQGIIHRDIKPANVMLDLKGHVKLGDFGVAQIADIDDDLAKATCMQGSTVGTLKYLSPEQVAGEPLDARADLFAAGVVMYQMLTGTKPFEGDSDFAVMQAIAQHDPVRPSSLNLNLPAGIDTVLFKALAKNRDDRYASAWDFALALRTVTARATAGAGWERVRAAAHTLAPVQAPAPALATYADDATRLARPLAPRSELRAVVPGAVPGVVATEMTEAAPGTRVMAVPAARGNARVLAVVTTIAVLVGGGGWILTRDASKPPMAIAPTPRPFATATASAPLNPAVPVPVPLPVPVSKPVAVTLALIPAGLDTPISAPVSAPASAAANTVATMAQAIGLEGRDLTAALAAYTKIATGADKKVAAEAARRLWTLYRDGAKGLAVNPQQAQRWYDRAKQMGAKLPQWDAERTGPSQALTAPAGQPAAPRSALAGKASAPPSDPNPPAAAPFPAPAVGRDGRDIRETRDTGTGVAVPPAVPLPAASVAAKPSVGELFERGQKLEGTSLRQAESAYRDAAQQGHGASQKRLWELLLKAGRETEAVRYQREAWDQKVPGVPEPRSAIRL